MGRRCVGRPTIDRELEFASQPIFGYDINHVELYGFEYIALAGCFLNIQIFRTNDLVTPRHLLHLILHDADVIDVLFITAECR